VAALLTAVLAVQAAALASGVSRNEVADAAFMSAADLLLSQAYLEPAPPSLVPARNDEHAGPDSAALLVKAIIQVESRGDAQAVGKAGERGLMQIKRDTWRETTRAMFGGEVPFDQAFEAELNRKVGRRYLAQLQQRLKQCRDFWKADERALLLASYNAGPQRVARSGFDLQRVPAKTRDYVARVTALHDYYLRNEREAMASRTPGEEPRALRLARAAR
jgi:soluble lytic murein transglycosylase-like protein